MGRTVPVGPRVLTMLSAAGRIVRASNDGAWTTSRPRWASMDVLARRAASSPPEAEGTAGLVEAWLRAFGPGTDADIEWWLGSTLTAVRRALADAGRRRAVDLDGRIGYVMPDDLDDTRRRRRGSRCCRRSIPPRWAGRSATGTWARTRRDVFDRNGNAGATIWCDGRIVGGWRQDRAGEVEVQLLEDVGREARRAIDAEAARLRVGWPARGCSRASRRRLPTVTSPRAAAQTP